MSFKDFFVDVTVFSLTLGNCYEYSYVSIVKKKVYFITDSKNAQRKRRISLMLCGKKVKRRNRGEYEWKAHATPVLIIMHATQIISLFFLSFLFLAKKFVKDATKLVLCMRLCASGMNGTQPSR